MERDVHSQELQLYTPLDTQITKATFDIFLYIIIHFYINMGQFLIIHAPKDGTFPVIQNFVYYTFFVRIDL